MKKLLSLFAITLFLLCAAAEEYRVLVLGDIHYDRRELHTDKKILGSKSHRRNLEMWKKATPELLTQAGEAAKSESVRFAIQLGDITHGYAGTEELQRQLLTEGCTAVKKYFPETPLLIVRGNHDAGINSGADGDAVAGEVLTPTVAKAFGADKVDDNGNCAIRQGDDLFIAVNGFLPAEKIIAFVKQTLEANPETRYVFFLTHLPVLPASASVPFWLLPGNYKVAELLETRQTLILAAHTHVPSMEVRVTKRGMLRQLVVSSMGNQWDPASFTPPRYTSWEEFVKIAKSRPARKRNKHNAKRWPALEASGTYFFRELFLNSGWVMLHIDDAGYTVEYFTGRGKASYRLREVRRPASATVPSAADIDPKDLSIKTGGKN